MILGVIPARGGSKGIPRKNVRDMLGRPLIHWSIEAARNSELLDAFLVSTDDPEIASVAREAGSEVLDRPAALATDEATTLEVLRHVLDCRPEAKVLVVLQPTSPIRSAGLVDFCIERFLAGRAGSLATGWWCKYAEYGSHNNLRRQDMKGFFYDDGNIYVISADTVRAGRWAGETIERVVLGDDQSREIDDEADWTAVEALLERRLLGELRGPLGPLRLLATDVDGTLTDGGMYYGPAGEALKKFNTRDGKGLELLRKAGIQVAIVTGEDSDIVRRRAEKLAIANVHCGVQDKLSLLAGLAGKLGVPLAETAFVGDDLNDLEVMRAVGFSAAPRDAVAAVRHAARYICRAAGGAGCVREVCDLILSSRPG